MDDTKTKKLYTTHEVAKLLGVTPITVIRWIENGRFKCFTTVGGHRRIDHDELVRFAHSYNLPWKGEEELSSRKEYLILVVDDEAEIREVIADILSGLQGVKVIEAGNGFSAGAKLVEERPDLILLDFLMPEIDGFEFCKFVRQDPRFREVPILGVSGLTTDMDIAKMRQAGVTDILPKPFSGDALMDKVGSFQKLKMRA